MKNLGKTMKMLSVAGIWLLLIGFGAGCATSKDVTPHILRVPSTDGYDRIRLEEGDLLTKKDGTQIKLLQGYALTDDTFIYYSEGCPKDR